MNQNFESCDQERITPPPLRFQFVGMLFALAIAEVAVRWAEVVGEVGLAYNSLPAHLHLALAVFLTANSWIGWSRSLAPGNKRSIVHPFSVEYLILLVDVSLVILYFMVARSVDFLGDGQPGASAREEAVLVSIIFGLYLVWDFLTTALFPGQEESASRLSAFSSHGSVSGACFLVSLVGVCVVGGVTGVLSVSIADTGLISLVFLFRAWKERFVIAAIVSALIVVISLVGAAIASYVGY